MTPEYECENCGKQIEGDFDDMDAPKLCEECAEHKFKDGVEHDKNVDLYESNERYL